MSKHTPEPWKYELMLETHEASIHPLTDQVWFIATVWDGVMGERTAMQNARRIVACVNACAGIDNDTLESDGSIAEIIASKRARIAELEGLNDDWLENNNEQYVKISELEAELARYRDTVEVVSMQRNAERAKVERLREALSELLPEEIAVQGLFPIYLHSSTIAEAREALAATEPVRD